MVAKVISGKDIQGALNYNEQKVLEGKATLIQANGFMKELDMMNFYDKLRRFTDLNDLNERTKTNTFHISLNFDPSENLSVDDLYKIASLYMDKVGFGDQPYLVYEHKDAAHQHVHIVTTLIREDGTRIPTHYFGKNQSEPARKEIEVEFGLVQATSKQNNQAEAIRAADVKKVIYGKSETRRSISNIVRAVTKSYRFTSLPELNAVLRQYNVIADRGTEKSRMFERRGLIYGLLDEKGKRIGIPVKASSIYGKPTLDFLEKQFPLNDALRQHSKASLKNSIDSVLKSPSFKTKQKFISMLESKGVAVIFRANADGRTYGITFVDNNSKTVFNGSALGKEYSANPILERLNMNDSTITQHQEPVKGSGKQKKAEVNIQRNQSTPEQEETSTIIKDLVTSDSFDPRSPEAALRLGKRRKRKSRRL
jgi:hypothetical protein